MMPILTTPDSIADEDSPDKAVLGEGIRLRPDQENLIAKVIEASESNRRVLMQAPCGMGKTVMAVSIIKRAVEEGKKVLFFAHRRELIWQTRKTIESCGIQCGIILADYPNDFSQPVQVASVQSLHAKAIRRSAIRLPEAEVVIADESHHVFSSRTWQSIILKYPEASILGLTATPVNRIGGGMSDHYDVLVNGPSIKGLIASGLLVQPKYFVPSIPDLSMIKMRHGDYAENELETRMNVPKLVGNIVENWVRIANGRKTIVFACGVKHSVHIAGNFNSIGIKAAHVDANTDSAERDEIIERFRSGDTTVLCNVGIASEGFDAPQAEILVFAKPTKSLLLYLQVCGRVLRTFPGKKEAVIIDHSGVIDEHGIIEQDWDWKLSYGPDETPWRENWKTRRKNQITCEKCKRSYSGQMICPECGNIPELGGRDVSTHDAQLFELSDSVKKNGHGKDGLPLDREKWYRGLKWWARERGYKPGWAYYKFIERFQADPEFAWSKLSPQPPTKDIEGWITSRNIKYWRRNSRKRSFLNQPYSSKIGFKPEKKYDVLSLSGLSP